MLGKSSLQGELFRPDNLYREHVGEDSFYAFLAEAGPRLFRDEDYAGLYKDIGRPSVPPSRLCVALILQTRDAVSDEEAIERTAFDLRWKVALQIGMEEKLCSKSTLQLFRAKLILHDEYQRLFERSVEECRRAGLIRRKKLEVAIDTTPIFGRGAVKDTFNLVSDQIRRVVDEAVQLKVYNREELVERYGLGRHFEKSFKGHRFAKKAKDKRDAWNEDPEMKLEVAAAKIIIRAEALADAGAYKAAGGALVKVVRGRKYKETKTRQKAEELLEEVIKQLRRG